MQVNDSVVVYLSVSPISEEKWLTWLGNKGINECSCLVLHTLIDLYTAAESAKGDDEEAPESKVESKVAVGKGRSPLTIGGSTVEATGPSVGELPICICIYNTVSIPLLTTPFH